MAWTVVVAIYVAVTLVAGLAPFSDEPLRAFASAAGSSIWWFAAFVALYALRPLLLLSASLLSVGAGFVFGPWLGVAATVLGANLGAALAFGIGRAVGSEATAATPALARRVPFAGGRRRLAERLKGATFEAVLLMRLAFVPYDLVNYAAGAAGARFVPFIAATVLGSLPGTLAFVFAGASGGSLDAPSFDPRWLGVSALVLLIGIAASRWARRRARTA